MLYSLKDRNQFVIHYDANASFDDYGGITMITGYEKQMYYDINKIASELEMLNKHLEVIALNLIALTTEGK